MKKLSNTLLFAAAAILLATIPACSLKEMFGDEEGEGIVLSFCSDESILVTKASSTKEGVDAYNENVLNSVEYFLYSDINKNGNAVIHGYLENVRQNAPVSIPMTSDIVNYTLCPNNANRFWVYAIANHPRIVADTDPEDLTGTDVATLAAKTRDIEITGAVVDTPQSSFLMSTDGLFEVTPIKRRNTIVASANIGLKRVAAKITVSVRVVPEVEVRNTVTISGVTDTRTEIWKPRLNEMYVYLVNGAKTGKVDGTPVEGSDLFTYQQTEFNMSAGESYSYDTYTKKVDEYGNEIYDSNGLVIYEKETKTGVFYPANIPFYTYPEQWMYGSEEEPYLKIGIPWDREPGISDGGTAFGATNKMYYYRVYCPASAIDISNAQFLRNNWYKVVLNVGILGSETDGGEMIIEGNYYVVDWQERETGSGSGQGTGINDSDKEAEIKGARYLFLNEQNFTMYNLEDLMIPYVTSDPCEIVNFSAKKYDFSGSTKQEITTNSMATWNMDVNLVTTGTGAHISFNHPLNNDTTTDDYDVSPYIITFTIRHKDDVSYSKVITIEQKPAIIIDSQMNTDGNNDQNHGYVYINAVNSTSGDAWTRNSTLGGENNANPNMYLISTSVLSDSEMLIGDPRTSDAYKDSDLYSGWSSASRVYIDGTANHRLTNYYPAESDEAFKDVIAPVFRVASSYGKSQSMSYDNARRRCASYQEDGYPAGRWRIPTMAEVLFITTLSQKGMIPELFTFNRSLALDESYWCASGKIDGVYGIPTYYSGTDGSRWIRCVYDEWYWSDMKINGNDASRVTITDFTWGDIPR